MKIETVVPMLTVPEILPAVAFYRDILGFGCANQMEAWACVTKDGVEVMFALPNAHLPFDKPQFTGSLYFRCEDVDAMWEQVKSKADVVYAIETFDYGMREFAIRDNNGYLLQFGQELR
jgi:uncharacterized glyoxalase superfamily protein PhnB